MQHGCGSVRPFLHFKHVKRDANLISFSTNEKKHVPPERIQNQIVLCDYIKKLKFIQFVYLIYNYADCNLKLLVFNLFVMLKK